MKELVKSFVGSTANNRLAWFAYRMCGGLARNLGQIYGHARFSRETIEHDDTLARFCNELFPDRKVVSGPFKGLKYPRLRSVGSALLPKLLGSYESELHAALEMLLKQDYSTIVDIGCAEGYYAVGLALRLPNARIYAFDADSRARDSCAEVARLNCVDGRIQIGSFCDVSALGSIPFGSKALIIADCEGYENTLFSGQTNAILARHDLIVEVHDFIDISISECLRDAFSKTHCVESIKSIDDIEKVHRYHYEQLRNYDTGERRLILAERRPAIMEWLVMTPF